MATGENDRLITSGLLLKRLELPSTTISSCDYTFLFVHCKSMGKCLGLSDGSVRVVNAVPLKTPPYPTFVGKEYEWWVEYLLRTKAGLGVQPENATSESSFWNRNVVLSHQSW